MAKKGSKRVESKLGEKKYKTRDSAGREVALWAKNSDAARKKASRLGLRSSGIRRIWSYKDKSHLRAI